MKRELLTVALAVLFTLPKLSNATGRMECEPVYKAVWITEAELQDKLVAEVWSVRRMKFGGGNSSDSIPNS